MDALKAEQLTGAKWRLLAIPFGGPFNGKDMDGEFFDAETDIKPHWFKVRPVVFHHGEDPMAKSEDYGEQELDAEPEDDGWWSTVWLNRAAKYWAQVDKMLRNGKMHGSSGAVSHFVRKNRKSGHIEVWPHAEQTLTLTPINPYSRITATKAVDAFNLAGIALDDDLRRDLLADGEPSGDLFDGGELAAMRTRLIARTAALNAEVRLLR